MMATMQQWEVFTETINEKGEKATTLGMGVTLSEKRGRERRTRSSGRDRGREGEGDESFARSSCRRNGQEPNPVMAVLTGQ
jgi:hypothetical protein